MTATENSDQESGCSACCRKIQINRSLLPVKFFYLTFMGIGCVIPYVSVFLKQLGMGAQQIGVISGVRPAVGFISGPVWGIVGDRYRVRHQLLLFSILAWAGVYLALFHVPEAPRTGSCPARMHRDPVRLHRHHGGGQRSNVSLRERNLTEEEEDIMRENIGWIYEASGLNRVFITAFVLIVCGEFFQAPTIALSDAGAIQTLGPGALDQYGAQRAWGAIGWAISSFLGGSLVSFFRRPTVICGVEITFSQYRILAYVFSGFMFFCLIAATQLKFKDKGDTELIELTSAVEPGDDAACKGNKEKTEDHGALDVVLIFNNLHYGSWLATCFYVGICNGLIWGFLYWHLENLGADQMLMGVDGMIQCIAEFFAFSFVHKFIDIVGHMPMLYMGLLGYSIRFFVYAFIKNPWLALPCDILQGVTFSCVWVSMTSYTALSVPEQSLATSQGILHGVYTGLGNGVGHLIGGVLIGHYGAAVTFFSMGVATFIVMILFIIAQTCSTKPPSKFSYVQFDRGSHGKVDEAGEKSKNDEPDEEDNLGITTNIDN